MAYFTTRKVFMMPSFDLEVKEQAKMDRFLLLLENSGVGEIIARYVKNQSKKVVIQDITITIWKHLSKKGLKINRKMIENYQTK